MSTLDPKKLSVFYKNSVPVKSKELPRKYTLTHSDETGELFLTIGKEYDYDKIGPMRDEVVAQWITEGENNVLEAFINVDGNLGLAETIIRDSIFRRELPLALTAIVYGDGLLLEANEQLQNAKIKVNFKSKYPEYNVVEDFGVISDYKYVQNRMQNMPGVGGYYPNQYQPYPYPPIPPIVPIPLPNPKPKQHIKGKIIGDALITMLDPYIKSEVNRIFGKKTPYCLKRAEVMEVVVVNKYSPCTDEYEIIVGIKVGKNPPPYNNLIIRFLINENEVKVIGVKTPRNDSDNV